MVKKVRYALFILLFLSYLTATIVHSNYWGNILSPINTFIAFFVVFTAFYYKEKKRDSRLMGLLLSLGILAWAITDLMWAFCDLLLHINPEKMDIFNYGYALTNLCIAASLAIYLYQVFRKWNGSQVLLDSAVMSFFVIEFIWIIFFNEDIRNLIRLRGDLLSSICIIIDILMIIWIVIWFMSVRNGIKSWTARLLSTAILLFAITDLVYYYQLFFAVYKPNTIIDSTYVTAFMLITIAGIRVLKSNRPVINSTLYNVGRKGKGGYLLIAPVILILFKGIVIVDLLHFLAVIIFYYLLSSYIQNNIFKESLLKMEKEHNNELEGKIKARTAELEDKNRVLNRLLDQDFITGLKNRRFLLEYLDRTMNSLTAQDTILLLYIDINRFKLITTMYGHYVGDMIMYEMAEKLKPMEKFTDCCSLTSYGDDTFIFTAVGQYDYKQGYEFAQKAIQLCSDIYQIEEYQLRITVNIGISLYPKDASTKEDLIKHADIAMVRARHKGYNHILEFDAVLSKTIYRKNTIEIMLKKADFNREFMLYYQPQLQTEDKKLIGFEALLRWKTPSGEMIGPVEFIPIAEETGCIVPIGDWVIKTTLAQVKEWNKMFDRKLIFCINVSLKQLSSLQFADNFKQRLKELNVKPEWVDLEITESLQLQENPEVLKVLEEVRRLGTKISIDDFGTGYSSLSYLKNFPADRIKLAKELIDFVHKEEFDYELVKAIIQLSKAKGIRVIAEGVETLEQWEILKELQCDEVQGYLFGRPEPVDVTERLYMNYIDNTVL